MKSNDLKVVAVTCAKNEGPFIAEWVAYHKLIGFTDFVVFTNDCTDGTDDLLDRMDEMGLIRHLPNPRLINDRLRFQAAALQYASNMREVRMSDWRLSFDSDEFVNVTPGHGRVADLVNHSPDASLISICQLQFGCSNRETFEPGLTIDQFRKHQSNTPQEGTTRRRDLERGLKTFIHRSAPVTKWNNHLPELDPAQIHNVRWVYGDNLAVGDAVFNGTTKSLPAAGCYDLAQLNHYATRSCESFLVQSHRGNAVKLDQSADVKYWKRYNHNAACDSSITRHSLGVQSLLDEWFSDSQLKTLQQICETRHHELISKLKQIPEYIALLNRVKHLSSSG